MFQTLKGYRVNNFPAVFSRVLESWFDVILQYEAQTRNDNEHGDAIYWYNERANVGAFAAALARKGNAVIEEYSCLKGRGADKGPGRADLSFCYRNHWYLVEAKLKWPQLYPASKSLNFEEIKDPACKDAKRTWQQDKGSIPLGLTFVVPHIHPQYSGQITECVKHVALQLKDENQCNFWAYCAPGRLRELQAKSKDYYPMVLLLASKPA